MKVLWLVLVSERRSSMILPLNYEFGYFIKMMSILVFNSFMISILIGNSFKLWFETFEKFHKRFLGNFLSNEVEMVSFIKCRISSLLVLLFIYKRAIRMGYHPSIILTQLHSWFFSICQCYMVRLLEVLEDQIWELYGDTGQAVVA